MSLTRAAKIDLLADLDRSSPLGAGVLFPETFHRPFDKIHKPMFEVIDRRPGDSIPRTEEEALTQPLVYSPYKCLIAPRGVGKTSIGAMLVPTIAILLQRYRYIVIIGHNAGDAIEKSEELKYKLTESLIVKELYGDITTDSWSKDEWVIRIGSELIKVHPRGSGQPVRGRKYHDHRPGLILVDDLEKAEETETEEQRAKKKTWFYGDVLNAIDRGATFTPGEVAPWEILVVGTILHHDSLLLNLDRSKYWDSVRLEICNDQFEPCAPNFMDKESCHKLYLQFKEDSELDVWFREYRNNPVPTGEDAAFQDKYFLYYSEQDLQPSLNPNVETVVIVDPSRTANPSSNPTGIVAVGVNMKDNEILVRDCISKRMHVEEMYDAIAHTITQYDARVLAVEVTGLHEFITHPLKTFLSARGIHIEFIELQARQGVNERGKAARVRSLVDFYRQGIIKHNSRTCDVLEQQLFRFPSTDDWSLMDPLGYIVELLEKGERYLSFPGEADLETDEQIEAEYRELEKLYAEEEEFEEDFLIDFGVPI